jgi:hypothetical protein
LATTGSSAQSMRALTSGPATRSRAAAISSTVVVSDGMVTAVLSPHSSPVAVAARISAATALAGEASAASVPCGTGHTARMPARGSLMMPDRKLDAAVLGRPARTEIVASRMARPRRYPLRV